MPLAFRCPHCQTLVRVPDNARGKRGRCPHCKEINDIPAESEPAESEPAAEEPSPALSPLAKPASRPALTPLPLDPFASLPPPSPGPLDLLVDLPQTPGLTPIGGPYGDPLAAPSTYDAPAYGPVNYGGGAYGGGYAAPAASLNPYQAPAYVPTGYSGSSSSNDIFDESKPLDESGRPGVPWENSRRDNALFATVRQVLLEPAYAFGNMHRTGGLGRPLGFAVYSSLVVGCANVGYKFLLDVILTIPILAFGRVPNELILIVFVSIGLNLVLGLIGIAILGSLGAIFGAFVHAGVLHLVLMMLNGARARFEATFRLTCYVQGSVGMINLIPLPCISQLGSLVLYFVVMTIGIRWTHEISLGKSVAAVVITFFASILLIVIPLIVMAILLFAFFALIVSLVVQGMR